MATGPALTLNFGDDQSWELPSSQSVQSFMESNIQPIADLEAAVDQALESPIDFPSMDQVVVSDDSLVFALDPAIPCIDSVVPKILEWFVRKGSSPKNMRILCAEGTEEMTTALQRATENVLGESVLVETHDPDDEERVAYVAANEDSSPIYMNRTLVDADVVIPITCARSTSALDFLGAYGLYPLLSDRSTRGAFYRFTALNDPRSHEQLTDWANQAAM